MKSRAGAEWKKQAACKRSATAEGGRKGERRRRRGERGREGGGGGPTQRPKNGRGTTITVLRASVPLLHRRRFKGAL